MESLESLDAEVSLKEAAEVIGVPYRSAMYYHRAGLLPVRRIAGRALIDPEVLRATLKELGYRPKRTRTPAPAAGAKE